MRRFAAPLALLISLVAVAPAVASPAHGHFSTTRLHGQPAILNLHATNCGASWHDCVQAALALINHDRSGKGLRPLKLDALQSLGTSRCVGSMGHSMAMARTDSIWHVNSSSPRASFPKNICRPTAALGENVGEAGEGNTQFDLESLNSMMMSEPHSRSGCAHTVNHACNLLSPLFRRVGIGIDRAHGDTWLTEDFTG